MTRSPVDEYLSCLHKSKLASKEQIFKVLEQIKRDYAGKPVSLELVVQKFIEARLVTDWQNEKLLKGRHHGFFLGNYKLLRHIASGGMSNIYLAEHIQMQRQVAIKVLPPSLTNNASYLERFYVESRAIASLDHKNIVRAYDVAHDTKYHYLVLEYVDGSNLKDMVTRQGPLPFEQAADYIRQAADGLAHAHAKGLIHRDIKPANLLVDRDGVLKVLDMGLSRITHDEHSLTRAHNENVIGTVDYLAPEQAVDSHNVDIRVDIYGLGGTLYFLLTGHPPFPDGTHTQRLMKHRNEEPANILDERPDTPPELVAICRHMMAKKADDRPQTAGQVSQIMTKWLIGRRAKQTAELVSQPQREDMAAFRADSDAFDNESMSIDINRVILGDVSEMSEPHAAAQIERVNADEKTDYTTQQLNLESRLADLAEREVELATGESDLANRETELAERQTELAEREVQWLAKESEMHERLAAINRRGSEVDAATLKLTKLDQYLEEKSAELEQRANDVEKVRAKLNQLEQFLEKKATELERRHREIEKARVKLNRLEQFLEQKAADVEKRSDQVEETTRQVETLQATLSEREDELGRRESEFNQQLNEGASERQARLVSRQQELDQRHQSIAAALTELESGRASLAEQISELAAEKEGFAHQLLELDQRKSELELQQAQFDQARVDFEYERAAHNQQQSEFLSEAYDGSTVLRPDPDSRPTEVTGRMSDLVTKEAKLAAREAELEAREAACLEEAAELKSQAELMQRSTSDVSRRWEQLDRREADLVKQRKELDSLRVQLQERLNKFLASQKAAKPAGSQAASAKSVAPAVTAKPAPRPPGPPTAAKPATGLAKPATAPAKPATTTAKPAAAPALMPPTAIPTALPPTGGLALPVASAPVNRPTARPAAPANVPAALVPTAIVPSVLPRAVAKSASSAQTATDDAPPHSLQSDAANAPRALFGHQPPSNGGLANGIDPDFAHAFAFEDNDRPLLPTPVDEWPFADPPEAEVYTSRRVIMEGQPILIVDHEEVSGAWRFMTGGAVDPQDVVTLELSELASLDPTVCTIANLPLGWQAYRASARDPWHQAPHHK